MLTAQNIEVSFGAFTLFENLNFRLSNGDRVALIGKNGAGKSTLLKLIAQEQYPTTGNFAIEKKCKIGYLPQDLDFENTGHLLHETYKAFEELIKIEKRQEKINFELENRKDYESNEYSQLIIELTESTSKYELLGGGSINLSLLIRCVIFKRKRTFIRILFGLGTPAHEECELRFFVLRRRTKNLEDLENNCNLHHVF